MSSYTISATAQFMENHLAAQPLEPQSALAVAKTADGHVMLFSIDQAQALRVTIGQDGHPTGWTTAVISGGIPAQPSSTLTVKAFGAAQGTDPSSGAPGSITLMVAVTVAGSGSPFDQVYVTTLAADAGAPWVGDPAGIGWTARPFDYSSTQLPLLVAGTLNVADVMLAAGPGGTPFAVATVVDPGNGVDRPFAIDLAPADTANLWTYLVPEQDYTTLLDSALGQPRGALMMGIYKLYSYTSNQQAEVALTFKPRVGQYPARFFQVTPNATAIAAVPLLAGSGQDFTTLLVADGGSIVVYPADDATLNEASYYCGTPVAANPPGSTILSGVSALHAVADGAVLSVWGVNGSGQIFYLQAGIDDAGNLSDWSVPLPLLSNVVRAAPYLSESRQLTAIYAVVTDPTTQAESLVELARDPVAGSGWSRCQVQLPSTNEYVTLQTYTTRVQVTDAGTGLATPAAVQVTASSSVVLQVNGLYYTLTPGTPVSLQTDAAGCLTLMQVVGGLGAPTYGFAVVDPASGQAQPPAQVDPTTGVRAQLATYTTGPQLLQAQTTTVQGQPKPLLNGVSPATAGQIASGIQAAGSVVPPGTSGTRTPFRATAPAALAATGLSAGGGILADLGDLAQAVANAFGDVVAWVAQTAEGAWQLVVQVGETIFNAAIQTAEDVVNCIVTLFNAVETAFEDIFRWLAFLFDWDNILTIQKQLVVLHNTLLQGAAQVTSQALITMGAWIEYVGETIQNDASALLSRLPDQTPTALAGQSQRAQGQTGRSAGVSNTDPRLYWGQSQLSTPSGEPSSTAPAALAPAGDSGSDPVLAAAGSLASAIAGVSAGWAGDLQGLVDGSGTLQSVVAQMLGGFGSLVTDAGALVEAVGADVESLFTALEDELNAELQIPLFSALYSAITGGEPLTVLGLVCLIEAVPATLVYGIATNGQGQAADFLPAGRLSQITATLSQVASSLPQPPSAGAASVPARATGAGVLLSTRAAAAAPATAGEGADFDALRFILGTTHIVRMITTLLAYEADKARVAAGADVPMVVRKQLSKVYFADGFVWCLEGVLGLASDHDSVLELVIGLCNTSMGFILAKLSVYVPNAPALGEALSSFGSIGSLAIGLTEVANGIVLIAETSDDTDEILIGAADITYGVNEVLELPADKLPSAAPLLLGIRLGLMATAATLDFIISDKAGR